MKLLEKIKTFFTGKKQDNNNKVEQKIIDPNAVIDIGFFYPCKDPRFGSDNLYFKYGDGRSEVFALKAFRDLLATHSESIMLPPEKKE